MRDNLKTKLPFSTKGDNWYDRFLELRNTYTTVMEWDGPDAYINFYNDEIKNRGSITEFDIENKNKLFGPGNIKWYTEKKAGA